MPPRRSSRSARPSVEPSPAAVAAAPKRKRSQHAEIDEERPVEGKENVAKPPSRARRSSSVRESGGPGIKGRISTRSRVSLQEVPESDDEALEDAPPPVKKARPSLEKVELDNASGEDDVKPRRRAAAGARQSVQSKARSSQIAADDAAPAPRKASARGSRAAPSTSSVTVRTLSRSTKSLSTGSNKEEAIAIDTSDESVEEEVKPAPKKGKRAGSAAPSRRNGARASSAKAFISDDEEIVRSVTQKPQRATSTSSKKVGKRVPPPVKEEEDEKEDDGNDEEQGDASGMEESTSTTSKSRIAKRSSSARNEPPQEDADNGLQLLEPPSLIQSSPHEEDSDEEGAQAADAVADVTQQMPLDDDNDKSLLDPPVSVLPSMKPQAPIEEPSGPKPRLVIHKMALVNFKSYAGRQEIGPFHKSFSAIVGPNGSGKSNTIDALLFVFGYRASKMRQGKLSELIHNSARYPDLDDCSVEVHFREIIDLPGPDKFTVVPNSQLVVSRQAFRNNSSRYTINGRQSNFTEVQTLLKSRGIDLDHKRFLILQGEVESIAQMKPKAVTEHDEGLLEYLEDIIGTSRYKEPIEEALVEMERLQEDRADKLNRLRIVEKEKNALEDKKKEAEDYLRLQNEHVRALSRLWQWYLWKCLCNEEEFRKQMARYEKELADETERNKDDITHLEMLEKHYEERQKTYQEVQAAAIDAGKDLAAHEKQAVGLEERRKHSSSKTKKLKKTLQDDRNAKTAALRAIEDSSEKMDREKRKVEEHEASLKKEEKILEDIRDSLKDKTQVFHDQIEAKQRELQPWTAKINVKQSEINVATSERDALTKKAEAVKEAGREAQQALEKLQEDQRTKIAGMDELKTSKGSHQQELVNAQKTLKDMQSVVQDLRSKASTSRQKADEARSSQAANTSQNRVLDSLTRLKNTGRISGFHGRLGSLGTIPEKYDVAITTACGALNNLVVDTVDQGQACIEYLRNQNIGRASFLVLEKLPRDRGLAKIPTPENVPRLFDLITPKDPKFAPAFYKGVHNTLVADTLEQANRIAYGAQRWRVVTLQGQLIDSSGTMSGGGTTIARGGMSAKLAADTVPPDVLRKYEQDSEEAARRLDTTLQELKEVEAEVDRLMRAGPQLDMALDKAELDIKNGTRRIAEAETRVRDLRSRSKPDAADISRIAALEKEIATASEELEALQSRSGAIEKAIEALEKKILDIGGSKLLTQRSKVDGIRLHINLANDEITKAEVAKAKAEKDSVKLDSSIDANTAALQEVEAELEELNSQLEELSAYVSELQSKVEAAQAAAENSKEDLENLKAELDAKTEEIRAFREKEMELKQLLSNTEKEAKENDKLLEHWRMEHDKLRLEDIDEDDEDDEDEEIAAVKTEAGDESAAKAKPRKRTPSHELHMYSVEELGRFKKREMIADAELLDEKLKNAKPNLGVLKEYRKREEEYFKRATDLDQITADRDAQKQRYDGLRKQRLDEFMAGFNLISMKLKEMYQMITLGGNAELELVDSMDPFSEGIIFSVMPPKKSWKNISNLSGGEKTLSSLALVFALHVFKPTPLYFMDEIDAALDFRNVSIVANYIKDRTKNAQFIIISLRNDMFELSHRLIGIYKTANATQSISIDNHALSTVKTRPVPS